MKKVLISETKLRKLIREAVINEISQPTKASAFVRTNNDINRLNQMRNNGERTYMKNGRRVDIDNELKRRNNQLRNFGDGLAHDLSMEYDPRRERFQGEIERVKKNIADIKQEMNAIKNGEVHDYNGYKMLGLQDSLKRAIASLRQLNTSTNGYRVDADGDNYSISTPNGHSYSNRHTNGIQYKDGNSSNVNRLDKLQGVTDAMKGLDDELNGGMDREIDSLRRRQKNVQALRDYDDAYARWKAGDNEIRSAQRDYDNMSVLNPKKWFSKRPADGPQAPLKPKWEPNENGEFDGYFAHTNPEEYDDDVDDVLKRQTRYRDAKNKYFNR